MGKKEIQKDISKTIKIDNVFLSDLRFLEGMLVESIKGEGYRIEYGGFEYDNLDEVLKDNPTRNEINFQVSQPFISITISSLGVRTYVNKANLEAEGLISAIENHFKKRKTRIEIAKDNFSKVYAYIGGSLFPIAIVLYLETGRGQRDLFLYLACASMLNAAMFYWDLKRRTRISYQERLPSFITRHKDQIILGTFFAIVGAIIGALVTNYL